MLKCSDKSLCCVVPLRFLRTIEAKELMLFSEEVLEKTASQKIITKWASMKISTNKRENVENVIN